MSVKARTNEYGSFGFGQYVTDTTTATSRSGAQSSNTVWDYMNTHHSWRPDHQNSPSRTVLGVPNYRLPTTYRRSVYDIQLRPGHFYHIVDNPGNDPNATVRYDREVLPFFGAFNNWGWFDPYSDYVPNDAHPKMASLGARATNKCLLRLQDRKADVGTSLAEAVKSFDLVASSAASIMKALIAVKHGNFRAAGNALGVTSLGGISKRYLEYTYGWKPTMMDCYGAYQLLLESLNLPPVVTAKATERESDELNQIGYNAHKILHANISATTCVSGILSDSYKRIASQAGISDPLELAWELIPWSFVVDWVLPVGDFIRAMQAPSGLTFLSGWKGYRIEISGSIQMFDASGFWTVSTPPSGDISGFGYYRQALSDFPKPVLSFKSPFATSNAWNALALATQLLGLK